MMMVDPCSNQPEFVALAHIRVTHEFRRPLGLGIEHHVEAMQADAGDENRRHRNQRQRLTGRKVSLDHRALILAEQPLDPLQRDWIDVPGVAMDERHLLDAGQS